MSPREFDQLVERAIRKIPPRFRSRLHNVTFVVESEGANPSLLGLYHGVPLTHRSVQQSFTLPDRITIYQQPHERLARSPKHLAKMVEDTVWHEVAHYFGLDEAEVRSAERRRKHS